MKQYFLKLYEYNAWANGKVMECLKKQAVDHERILTLFSHVLSAQFLWLHRIKGLPPPAYELWKKYELSGLSNMVEESSRLWNDFVSQSDSFNRMLKYKNYQGLDFENNVESIMIHLVNHGTYHRGQIALLLRQNGFEPVNTDFITYDRVQTGQLS